MSLLVARERPLTSPLGYALIVLAGVVLALLLGAGLMLLWGTNPLAGYRELLWGMFGSQHSISESLLKATPLIITSLGIAVAFNASVWNIGAEGQFYMGALAATTCALLFSYLPGFVLWPLTLFAAICAGGLWASIAGYLRARFGINEIIVTVMLNYVAMYFVQYMLAVPLRETQAKGIGYPQTDVIARPSGCPASCRAFACTLGSSSRWPWWRLCTSCCAHDARLPLARSGQELACRAACGHRRIRHYRGGDGDQRRSRRSCRPA